MVQVLTRDHGRVHFVAKGAFRPKSGYAFVLDLFHTLRLEWNPAPRRELQVLTRAELQTRRRLSSPLPVYRGALMVLELTEIAARQGQRESGLFELATDCLDTLATKTCSRAASGGARPTDASVSEQSERLPATDVQSALIRYELGYLENLGLAPALLDCAACSRPAPPLAAPARARRGASEPRPGPRVHFSAGAGGRLCPECAAEARASGRRVGTLPVDVLETAQALASPAPTHPAPPVDKELLIRTRDAVERFLNYHLETRPRTQRAFLQAPNRNAP